MRDLYLKAMDIPVWQLRSITPCHCFFYRLNNAKNKTIAWIIADDRGDDVLLNKIAHALTPHIQKENAFSLGDASHVILLGLKPQQFELSSSAATIITAPPLSLSNEYKKALWEKLKPLRVLFDA